MPGRAASSRSSWRPLAAGAGQPDGHLLAGGARPHPGRGHIPLALPGRGDDLGQGQADPARLLSAGPHRGARAGGPALRLLAVGLAEHLPAVQVLLEAPVDDEVAERPRPRGREVGPPRGGGRRVAGGAGSGASSADEISQVARTPPSTTEATTTAMATPAGPPSDRRRVASWRRVVAPAAQASGRGQGGLPVVVDAGSSGCVAKAAVAAPRRRQGPAEAPPDPWCRPPRTLILARALSPGTPANHGM